MMAPPTTIEELLKRAAEVSSGAGTTGSVVWNPSNIPSPSPFAPLPGFIPLPPPPLWNPQPTGPLPPPAWPDNTLIQEMLVRMDKELAEALKLLLKRLDKIDEVVERIEQSGRYSSG